MFGVFELGSPLQMIATVPEFIWELGLGIWLNRSGVQRLVPGAGHAVGRSAAPACRLERVADG